MISVEYRLSTSNRRHDLFYQGGIRIISDGIILTKRENDPSDEGFRGDYLFDNFLGLLICIPLLAQQKQCSCPLLDHLNEFAFIPVGPDTVLFLFRTIGEGTQAILENKRYPGFGLGTPIRLSEFTIALVDAARAFLEFIKKSSTLNLSIMKEVQEYENAIDEALQCLPSM